MSHCQLFLVTIRIGEEHQRKTYFELKLIFRILGILFSGIMFRQYLYFQMWNLCIVTSKLLYPEFLPLSLVCIIVTSHIINKNPLLYVGSVCIIFSSYLQDHFCPVNSASPTFSTTSYQTKSRMFFFYFLGFFSFLELSSILYSLDSSLFPSQG